MFNKVRNNMILSALILIAMGFFVGFAATCLNGKTEEFWAGIVLFVLAVGAASTGLHWIWFSPGKGNEK